MRWNVVLALTSFDVVGIPYLQTLARGTDLDACRYGILLKLVVLGDDWAVSELCKPGYWNRYKRNETRAAFYGRELRRQQLRSAGGAAESTHQVDYWGAMPPREYRCPCEQ